MYQVRGDGPSLSLAYYNGVGCHGSGVSILCRVAQRPGLVVEQLLSTCVFEVSSPCLVTILWRYFLALQGMNIEAAQLYERCQVIQGKTLGPQDLSLATTLHNRAGLLMRQVNTVRKFNDVSTRSRCADERISS